MTTVRRKLVRNSRDPQFQGDGWRWTLSLAIPQVRIPGLWLNNFGFGYRPGPRSRRTCPYTIDLLVLTEEQRRWVYAETLLSKGGRIDGPLNDAVAVLLMEDR